jgi:hypothetical protein
LPLFILFMFIILKKRETKNLAALILLGWSALFLIHPKSVGLWQSVELLSFVQFPWRFLGIALFFFSLSVGSLMLITKNKKRLFIVMSLLIIGFYSGFFSPKEHLDITDQDKFSGESWLKQQTISIFDYLPVYAEFPPSAQSPNTITSDNRISVLSDESGSDWRVWDIEVVEDDTKLILPILYFPGWGVTDNNTNVDIMPSPNTGTIEVTLGSGSHNLRANLENTPIRTFSNTVSLLAFLLIVFRHKLLNKIYE